MRRGRAVGVAGIVTMVMAVLAVCPCPAMMAAPLPEDGHGCCAGKAGLTVTPDTGSCCPDDARDVVADASVGVTLAGGWQAAPTVIAAAPALLLPVRAVAWAAPPAAPPILRI